ncbi:MAG: pilin [Candidatus Magasanikbacteria bacterium]
MFKFKIIILTIMVSGLLAPTFALAASDLSPMFNPLCWKQNAGTGGDERSNPTSCLGARQRWLGINDPTAPEGWVKDTECGGTGKDAQWGKCLPPGRTVASIALGGKRTFYNIGDYIRTVYKIGIAVASLLAAVMMVIAGLEWTASGGNSEAIGRAKKRIGGAAVGLVLAMGSYLILNTINPALVNLRLPQTYMIRQIAMPAYWCSEFADPAKTSKESDWVKNFADAGLSSANPSKDMYDKLGDKDFKYSTLPTSTQPKTICGKQYFPQGGGGATCFGDSCEESQVCRGEDCKCFPPPIVNPDENDCKSARIAVTLSGFELNYEFPWANDVRLVALVNRNDDYPGIDAVQYRVVNLSEASRYDDRKIMAFTGNYTDSDILKAEQSYGFLGFAVAFNININFDPVDDIVIVDKNGSKIAKYCTSDSSYRELNGRKCDNENITALTDIKKVSKNRLFNSDQINSKQGAYLRVSVNGL